MTEADSFQWLPALLVLQGVIGAVDTLVNHGPREALPQRRAGRAEIALLVPELLDWGANPTELAPAHHGWTSWALSLLGIASAAGSIRDLLAFRRLGRP